MTSIAEHDRLGPSAEVAQLVERDLAKVEATSSRLVFRSIKKGAGARRAMGCSGDRDPKLDGSTPASAWMQEFPSWQHPSLWISGMRGRVVEGSGLQTRFPPVRIRPHAPASRNDGHGRHV